MSTSGTGSTEIPIRKGAAGAVGSDILSAKIVIDLAGEYNVARRCDAARRDSGNARRRTGITCTSTSTLLDGRDWPPDRTSCYAPAALATVAVEGAQGSPGGVTQFQGRWTTATVYIAGDIIIHNGVTYLVIVDHTSDATTEPGVGIDWEDFLAPLFETMTFGGMQCVINGNGYALDTGIKADLPVPFDCQIVEATLLADVAGSVRIDIWKDTYGAYPPTNADSITAAAPLTLVGANKTTDTTLAGWTTALTTGDTLAVVVESASVLTRLTVALRLERV